LAIMSLDADHLDIYKNVNEMHASYEALTYRVNNGGSIFLACDVQAYFSEDWRLEMASREIDVVELGVGFSYDNIQIEAGRFHFDYSDEEGSQQMISGLVGEHNIMNATIALRIAKEMDAQTECLKDGLEKFKGIKRRFELLYEEGIVLYDDYAHHPSELQFAIATIKALYPNKKVLGIFQPHLYSRTQDFYQGFAEVLNALDEIWLLPIYPARELPIDGVQTEMIFNLIRNDNKYILKEEAWLDAIWKKDDLEVIITLGASDIDKYHERLIEVLKDKN
ncbi:MAG: UDP-N-acetylmuramate--L-alanine ligase, partial [Saprospiraceae bacterium]|nr:UDP-N-acetylmuramate--L-alanine ligase [Saprospiraceae bacterium]